MTNMTTCAICNSYEESNDMEEDIWHRATMFHLICRQCADEARQHWLRQERDNAEYRESGSERADTAGRSYQNEY